MMEEKIAYAQCLVNIYAADKLKGDERHIEVLGALDAFRDTIRKIQILRYETINPN